MAKETTPSFITQIPLHTSSKEQAVLRKRFWAAKQQYNALLAEALKRLTRMRADNQFKQAVEVHKKKEGKKVARALFKELETKYGYSAYGLNSYTKQWNNKNGFLSIGAALSQQLAKRAFNAVKQYQIGKRGKPRYKGYRGISSIEDKQPTTLRLKDNTLHYLGLKLPLIYNLKDPIHHHGLNSKTKYIRLVRRCFNGKARYFAQLVNEGIPWVKSKNQSKQGIVGLDIGPQTLAVVAPSAQHAQLSLLADELKSNKQARKRLQRKLARKLRAGNPEAFQPNKWIKKDKHYKCKQGKWIKGKPVVHKSNAYQRTSAKLADISRREASYRKTQHGKMVNSILRLGNHIKTEKLSYKAFQRLYGSSVGLRAPGMLVETLKRKAESAGARVEECNTFTTKLSQSCHCGAQAKKKLSQRWHQCPCGVRAQRDLYSAYLACFVEKDKLIASQAAKAWQGMDIALHTAMQAIKGASSGRLPASLGLKRPGSELLVCDVS